MDIEKYITQLSALASKHVLSKTELTNARECMVHLKKFGMSVGEIVRLTKGRWSEPTIRGYTKGAKAADPSPWQDVFDLLETVISSSITLANLRKATTIIAQVESQGIELDRLIDMLKSAESASVSPAGLIQQYQQIKECALIPKDISAAVSLKEELEKDGITIDSLHALADIARKIGDVHEVFQAVSTYGTLKEILNQVTAAQGKLKGLNEQLTDVTEQLAQLQAKISNLKEPLAAYENVLQLGFTPTQLARLSAQAQKYGGVKKVTEAFDVYIDCADIRESLVNAKANLDGVKAKMKKLEITYAHLKSAINMCNVLLHEHRFSLDAIQTIFVAAKKYGEPLDVIKAAESYGTLLDMERELVFLRNNVAKEQELTVQLESERNNALKKLEAINALAFKVGAEVGRVNRQLESSKTLQKIVDLINDPGSAFFNEYAPIVLTIVASLQMWVIANGPKFRSIYTIKSGLETFKKELGG